MKHGPIALIDEFMPVVIIALKDDPNYEKLQARDRGLLMISASFTYDGGHFLLQSNIQEVLARKGSVIAITEEGNDDFDELSGCEYVLKVPPSEEFLAPLLAVVPLQLLAYHIADMRKCNVDQPRNLAKSVTVE
jgi:glucosamine--fructose-6-phosphate aminotransferase (isomerizing)